jgi:hypothetical protein
MTKIPPRESRFGNICAAAACAQGGNRRGCPPPDEITLPPCFELVINLLAVLSLQKANEDCSHTSPAGASTFLEKYPQVVHNHGRRGFAKSIKNPFAIKQP